MNSEQRTLLKRALPFLYEAAEPYIDDGGNEPLELAREIERTLEQPASAAGVEGMVLVPREPTGAMVQAAAAECERMKGVIDPVIHVWDAMLAAAPKPATTTGEGV